MGRKKVVLLVVEGPSDEVALQVPISSVFNHERVLVQAMHGDITSDDRSTPSNIIKRVHERIREHMSRYRYKKSDMGLIVHLMDLDGAYAPDEVIREIPGVPKTIYNINEILANSRESICRRNERKRKNMDRLSTLPTIAGMPYRAVYMSCNLDHALHNKLNTSDAEKTRDSYFFARKFGDDKDGFLHLICESEISVVGSPKDTWAYVRKGSRSLERHTNLGICLTLPPLENNH